MSIELDMALRWFAGGVFVGIVSVYWLRDPFAWIKRLMKWWTGHGVQQEG